MIVKYGLTAKKLLILETLSYPLILAPFFTEYLEHGSLPNTLQELTTEISIGLLFVATAIYVRVTRHELMRLDELRQILTETIVHDLRNPLTSFKGAIDFLAETQEADLQTRRQLISVAQNPCAAQMHLIDSLLDMDRLETKQFPINRRKFDAISLLQEASSEMVGAALVNHIEMTVSADDGMPQVFADKTLLDRVLANLISNALKYTPKNGTIKLKASHDKKRGVFLFSVEDTGSGVPPEASKKLFQRYYRIEGTEQRLHRGTGLGLYFCRLAVEAHGGTITVGATPQGGTVFNFTIK